MFGLKPCDFSARNAGSKVPKQLPATLREGGEDASVLAQANYATIESLESRKQRCTKSVICDRTNVWMCSLAESASRVFLGERSGCDWICSTFATKKRMPKTPSGKRWGKREQEKAETKGGKKTGRERWKSDSLPKWSHMEVVEQTASSCWWCSGKQCKRPWKSLFDSVWFCLNALYWNSSRRKELKLQCVCLSTLAVQNILQPVQQAQTGR